MATVWSRNHGIPPGDPEGRPSLRGRSSGCAMTAKTQLVICFGLAIWAIIVCAKIELSCHGHVGEFRGPMRRSLIPNEERWRIHQIGLHDKNGGLIDRPLTEDERRQMEKDIEEARSSNEFVDFFEFAGLLQYPVVYTILIWMTLFVRTTKHPQRLRCAAIIPIALALVSGSFMFYRSYFTCIVD